jgi:hypothetical protein
MDKCTNNLFVTTALQESALKLYDALSSRCLDNKDWEVVKTQMLELYGTQNNTTVACNGISKLYLGSKSLVEYFSEVSQGC